MSKIQEFNELVDNTMKYDDFLSLSIHKYTLT